MRAQYLTHQFNFLECFTAHKSRAADLTVLLLLFVADVCFRTLFSALLTAIGLSCSVGKRLHTTLPEIPLGFVAVSSVDIKLRQFSSLVSGCAIISLISFIKGIYSNCVFRKPLVFVELTGIDTVAISICFATCFPPAFNSGNQFAISQSLLSLLRKTFALLLSKI